jgi:hypothetical protein
MLLYFINQARQLGISELDLFEQAHAWVSDTDGDIYSDYVQYVLHGIMPDYLTKFLQHLQGEGK